MIAKIADRRKAEGFTLIELLVVIVILVALAAIAIPVFLNQKASADDAAAKSAVANAAAFISAGIADGSLTGSIPGALTSDTGNFSTTGFDAANQAYSVTLGTFCVSKGGWKYSNTSGAVVSGAC